MILKTGRDFRRIVRSHGGRVRKARVREDCTTPTHIGHSGAGMVAQSKRGRDSARLHAQQSASTLAAVACTAQHPQIARGVVAAGSKRSDVVNSQVTRGVRCSLVAGAEIAIHSHVRRYHSTACTLVGSTVATCCSAATGTLTRCLVFGFMPITAGRVAG